MTELKGKTAIVTGGSRGIGRAIVLELARRGANVAFTGRSLNENTESLEKEIAELGVRGKAYAADAASFEVAKELINDVMQEFGAIDILVNNAGIAQDALLMRMSEEQWDQVINVNLKSVFNLCHALIPTMLKARRGSIINMSSVVGLTGNAGQTNYAASKAGLIGFTKSLAQEVGARGIRVNAVTPGFIETDMTATLDDKVTAEWVKSIPLKRIGKPEDIAHAVAFLASDEASYITGHVLNVSGGMVM